MVRGHRSPPAVFTLPSYPAILTLLGLTVRWFGDAAVMIRAVEAAGVVLGLFPAAVAVHRYQPRRSEVRRTHRAHARRAELGSVVDGFAATWGITTVWGVVQLLRGGLKSRIPLGQYLTAGTMVTLLWP
ncbi:hypothetical protein GCM10009838_48090 [Catenulispora subtropica]|uniref:Uncharacterized protein n=1 Tax=Catenulispora subtropica TaxID=450798 RepID=A0ABN2S6F0_9ACTN